MTDEPKTEKIGLPAAINALRTELSDAITQGADEQLRFKVGPIELEFAVEVSREVGGKGGVQFWVVSVEASGKATNTTTHRVKLTLTPIGPDNDVVIAGVVPSRPE